MATVTLGPSSTRFAIFDTSKTSTLLATIHKLWLVISATYCVERVYRAFHHSPSALLPSDLKLVKCRAILDEFKEKRDANRLPECEALLNSISAEHSFKKQDILLDLVKLYSSMQSPDQAYAFALQLTSADNLLDMALLIYKENPSFNPGKFASLLTQAYNTGIEQSADPLREIRFFQKFAKDCIPIGEYGRMQQALSRADHLLTSFTDPSQIIHQIKFRCVQAECYQENGDTEISAATLKTAQKLCTEDMPTADLIEAHLTLANTFFSIGNDKEMKSELKQAMDLSSQHQIETNCLPKLAALITKINTMDSSVKDFFEKAFNFIQSSTDPIYRAHAYLKLAAAYRKLGKQSLMNQTSALAFEEIKNVPNTGAGDKKLLLLEVGDFYRSEPDKLPPVIELLQTSCEQSVFDNYFIVKFSETLKGQDRQDEWFRTFVLRLKTQFHLNNTPAHDRIRQLISLHPKAFTPEQTKLLLEEAEDRFSQVEPAHCAEATADIAKGYLQVDRQKSYALLDAYEKEVVSRETKKLIATAVATLVFMGISWVYPRTTPFLGAALVVQRFL